MAYYIDHLCKLKTVQNLTYLCLCFEIDVNKTNDYLQEYWNSAHLPLLNFQLVLSTKNINKNETYIYSPIYISICYIG